MPRQRRRHGPSGRDRIPAGRLRAADVAQRPESAELLKASSSMCEDSTSRRSRTAGALADLVVGADRNGACLGVARRPVAGTRRRTDHFPHEAHVARKHAKPLSHDAAREQEVHSADQHPRREGRSEERDAERLAHRTPSNSASSGKRAPVANPRRIIHTARSVYTAAVSRGGRQGTAAPAGDGPTGRSGSRGGPTPQRSASSASAVSRERALPRGLTPPGCGAPRTGGLRRRGRGSGPCRRAARLH